MVEFALKLHGLHDLSFGRVLMQAQFFNHEIAQVFFFTFADLGKLDVFCFFVFRVCPFNPGSQRYWPKVISCMLIIFSDCHMYEEVCLFLLTKISLHKPCIWFC